MYVCEFKNKIKSEFKMYDFYRNAECSFKGDRISVNNIILQYKVKTSLTVHICKFIVI